MWYSGNIDWQTQDSGARINIIALAVLAVFGALIFGFSDNRKAADQAAENEPVVESRVVPR